MNTQEVEVTGTAEIQFAPDGMEIGWSDSQVWVKYDGEVSTIGLDEDGFISGEPDVAKWHSGELMDIAIGAYEIHCEMVVEAKE